MSVRSDITAADGWAQGEDKLLEWAVVDADGAPLDLTGVTLLWTLFSANRLTEILAKTPTTFDATPTNNDGARVTIADIDTIDATGAVVIAAGAYWYELWKVNEGDEQRLAYGDAYLAASGRRQEVAP